MTRVAFVLAGRTGAWLGGLNYYRNLLAAIHSSEGSQIEPVLFVGEGYPRETLSDFPPVELHREPMLDRWNTAWARRTASRALLADDQPLGRLLARHGIAAMSHSGHLARFKRIPSIGWVPDLQHRRLPEFFDRKTWLWRDAKYRALAHFSAHLLTSSHAGMADLIDLAPRAGGKASVLQFVVTPPPVERQPSREELEREHGFSGRYLYLPNQFWVHKNHRLVVDALRVLEHRGERLQVLATGGQHDFRSPGHFAELMERARAAGVDDRFRPLGVVPYEHVTALLRGSVALVNPSLFEGWSTTVEEAKSLGKRALLSDIPVHREQAPDGAEYFDPHSPEALADAMSSAWALEDAAGDRAREEAAHAALPERRRRFVDTYEKAVLATLERT